ncbi:UNVERIFIED_CONTAM: hypothetical protein FKN15_066500 [Acipenser sinensis]
MSGVPGTCVIQVTNLSPAVTSEQMRTLFAFLGDVEELRLYPPDNAPLPFSSKVCYIKFREPPSVGVAQHLTNTVFIDRALIVVPCAEGKIPEEAKALSLLAPATTVATLMPGAGLLPIPTPPPLPSLGIPIGNLGTLQAGLDPSLAALGGISSQPPLMGNVDPSKIDEIRRTVYVGNLNSQTTTAEQLLEYFKQVGDVKFVRMAGDETQPTRFAFVEFADQESVPRALTFNGVVFGDRPLKINHSNNAIVKPPEMTAQAAAKELEDVMKRTTTAEQLLEYFKQVGDVKFVRMAGDETQPTRFAFVEFADQESVPRALTFNGVVFGDRPLKINHSNNAIVKPPEMTAQAAAKELEDVMKRVREAQSCISAAIEPVESGKSSTTSSKKAGRSRSRSQSKRKRSRSRHSRDKTKVKDNKSRSKEESSREKDERKRKEKKGKYSPKSYGSSRRSRSTSRIKKEERKEKIRECSRERNERERSPSRKKSSKDKEKLEKNTPVKVERDSDKEEKEYGSDKDSIHTNHLDHMKGQQNGSYNNHEEDLLVQTEVSE